MCSSDLDILSSYKLDPSGKLAQAMFGIHSPGLSKMGVDTSPFAGIFSGGNSMGEYLKGEANKQAAGEEFTKLAPHNIVPRYDFAPTKANVANSFASPQTGIIYNRLMEPPKPIEVNGLLYDYNAKQWIEPPGGVASQGFDKGRVGEAFALSARTGMPVEDALQRVEQMYREGFQIKEVQLPYMGGSELWAVNPRTGEKKRLTETGGTTPSSVPAGAASNDPWGIRR